MDDTYNLSTCAPHSDKATESDKDATRQRQARAQQAQAQAQAHTHTHTVRASERASKQASKQARQRERERDAAHEVWKSVKEVLSHRCLLLCTGATHTGGPGCLVRI